VKLKLNPTSPEALVVTLAEAKDYLRITHNLEDELITELIRAATARVESECFRLLNPHEVTALFVSPRLTGDDFGILTRYDDPDGIHAGIALSKIPITEVTSIKTIALDGTDAELDASLWYYNEILGAIQWTTNGVYYNTVDFPYLQVEYTAGYGYEEDVSLVPSDIKLAIRIIVADMYECRSSEVIYLPTKASTLLAKYRKPQYAG